MPFASSIEIKCHLCLKLAKVYHRGDYQLAIKERLEKALAFGGCNSRPGTGALHPMAIEVGCFSVTKNTAF